MSKKPQDPVRECNRHRRRPITCLAFSPDGEFLASGGADRVVRLWRTEDLAEVETMTSHRCRLAGVAFGPTATTLASFGIGTRLYNCGHDADVILWDRAKGEARPLVKINTSPIHLPRRSQLAVSPTGDHVACEFRHICVYATRPGESHHRLEEKHWEACPRQPFCFTPDGRQLVGTRGEPSVAELWTFDPTERVREIASANGGVSAMAFLAGGTLLAVAGNGGGLRLWEWEDEKVSRPACTLASDSSAFRLTPLSDGRLISVECGGTVRLWEPPHKQAVAAWSFQEWYRWGNEPATAVSPDGRYFAVGDPSGVIRLWDLAGCLGIEDVT